MKIALCCIVLFAAAFARAADLPYGQRDDVRSFIADMRQQGLAADELTALFAAVTRDDAVLSAINSIAPTSSVAPRSWRRYQDNHVDPKRIRGGLTFWRRHAVWVERASRQYHVPEEIIVAIIGIESFYGQQSGRFNTLRSLMTLSFDFPPRAALFRNELASLLLLAREQGKSAADYCGSFAGALGLAQFLPSSVRRWGVDFNHDGRIDLAEPADAIGSVAHFLADHGWQSATSIAVPVKVAGDVTSLLAAGIEPRYLPQEMSGVIADKAPALPAALIDLVTPGATTEYWLGFNNFYVLTRYNRSSYYAMAVTRLAQKLRAGRGHTAAKPERKNKKLALNAE